MIVPYLLINYVKENQPCNLRNLGLGLGLGLDLARLSLALVKAWVWSGVFFFKLMAK